MARNFTGVAMNGLATTGVTGSYGVNVSARQARLFGTFLAPKCFANLICFRDPTSRPRFF